MRRFRPAIAFALAMLVHAPVSAQVADHLQCYKVKDPQAKAVYTADLNGLAVAPGCTIKVPAKLACVPTTKTNVSPPAPETGGTGTPNVSFCYKVKCPKATLPALSGTDQFGERTVSPVSTQFVCAPVEATPTTTMPPTTTTTLPATTTTTLPATTTTTLPVFESCPTLGASCGSCDGTCVLHCPGPGCDNLTQVCVAGGGGSVSCMTDANCPTGSICVATHACVAGSCMSDDPFGGGSNIGTCVSAGCP